jgi:hypothetical protein
VHPARSGEGLRVTFDWILRHVLEKQFTNILKRWISNIATFEKVRENSTGKKIVRKKKVRGGNVRENKYRKKNTGKSTK